MFKRFAIALSVAFLFVGSGFWVSPANADWVVGIGNLTGNCVQFDWRGGTATYSGSGDGVFQVDVNNLTDNRIGGGSQADSWSIWVNSDKVVESQVIEQSQVGVTVSGDWVVTVQGIDVGFWAGWYGPQFCNPTFLPDGAPVVVPEPVVAPYVPAPQPTGDYRLDEGWGAHVVAPEGQMIDSVTAWYGDPNDGNRGADWSQFYTKQLHGLTEADLNSGNYNGDPLPGVYKVLVATVHFVQNPAYVAPVVVSSSEVRPETPPVQEVIPEPVVPVVPPVEIQPIPEPVAPSAMPEASPVSVPQSPSPEPSPSQVEVFVPEPVVPVIVPVPEPSTPPESVSPSVPPVVEPTPEPPVASSDVRPEVPPVQEVVPEPEPVVPAPIEPVPEPVVEPSPQPTPTPSEPPVQPLLEPQPVIVPQPVYEPPTVVTPIPPQPVETTPAPVELEVTPSPTHEQVLTELMAAAQQDDVEVPAEIAAIPVLGGAVVAIVDTFNALGNVGADMTPEVRATAKKEVIAAVIVGQVAQTASMMAASGSGAIRRRNNA